MHAHRPRPYITLLIAFVVVCSSFLIGPQSTDAQVVAQRYEIVVQLDGTADVDVTAQGFLEAADITEGERCWIDPAVASTGNCRLNHRYELVITGFSVFLTDFEIQRAHDILQAGGLFGITAITDPTTFSLPVVAGSESTTGSSAFATNEIVPAGVRRIGGGLTDASGVGVAVIDTGGDITHPDVTWGEGHDCTGANRSDDLPAYFDGHGHGTHVAGTIAGNANGSGVVGVAPGAVIYPVKVLTDQGSGSYASIICGLEWVAQHDDLISVVNMSLGGSGYTTACGEDDPFHNAVCVLTETVIVVVAAGNAGTNASGFSPANYPEVVTVSAYTDFDGAGGGYALPPDAACRAMSDDDSLASFSNDGEIVDVSAPGVCTLSTLPGNTYGYFSGTSMASPHVAGCLAGFLSRNPDQRAHAVDQMLTWSQARSLQPILGDGDGFAEPLASCNAIPRWSGQ